jgi:hypothetical protein
MGFKPMEFWREAGLTVASLNRLEVISEIVEAPYGFVRTQRSVHLLSRNLVDRAPLRKMGRRHLVCDWIRVRRDPDARLPNRTA